MNILYILPSYNLYGGTPRKTLDLLKSFQNKASLYLYSSEYHEFKYLFEETNANIYEGFYKRNIWRHLNKIVEIIDKDKIDIIQTQFSFGEVLGVLVKLRRPHVKVVISFETPLTPKGIRKYMLPIFYSYIDRFIYISQYVKTEREKNFPILKNKETKIIFNGTEKLMPNKSSIPNLKSYSLLDIAGLSDWKNIKTLVEMMKILIYKHKRKDIYLYVAGDGNERKNLELQIKEYQLEDNIYLLGNQSNVIGLLKQADIFVHPSYKEGFGIVVLEAMMEAKPIIVSNAGALPEIIEDNISGFLIEPFDAEEWAKTVLKLLDDSILSNQVGLKAEEIVKEKFSIKEYVSNHRKLYQKLLEEI